jgi:hypothetical protein
MFAIAFDLVVVDTERHHPKAVSQAYTPTLPILSSALAFVAFRPAST